MSLFHPDSVLGRVAAARTRSRSVARLTQELEQASDRRLADLGIDRADIAQVALAAYPSRSLAAAVLRSRAPWVVVAAPSHG